MKATYLAVVGLRSPFTVGMVTVVQRMAYIAVAGTYINPFQHVDFLPMGLSTYITADFDGIRTIHRSHRQSVSVSVSVSEA